MSQEDFDQAIPNHQIRDLWRDVYNGVGQHGRFLRSFGEAVACADEENLQLLRPVALQLIRKYGLGAKLAAWEEGHICGDRSEP